MNGASSEMVYGPGRAFTATGGSVSDFSVFVLGDAVGGSLTVSSGFDPYGIPDSQTVGVGFGYRGELHIGSLVYLRARDYDPVLGRFLTPDPLSGVPGTTTVTNPYSYAGNNPVGRVDPTGLRAEDSEMSAPARSVDPADRKFTSGGPPGGPLADVSRPRDKYDDFLDRILRGQLPDKAQAVSRSLGSNTRGRVRIGIFVESLATTVFGLGDNRQFDPRFDPEANRAVVIIDYDREVAGIVVSKSCVDVIILVRCFEAQPFQNGFGDNQAWIDESGSLIVGRLKNGLVPVPAIDFSISFEFRNGMVLTGSVLANAYPSYEVYYDDVLGMSHTLWTFTERGSAVTSLSGNPVGWVGPWLGG